MVVEDISIVNPNVNFSIMYPNLTHFGYDEIQMKVIYRRQYVNYKTIIDSEYKNNAKVCKLIITNYFPRLTNIINNCHNRKIKNMGEQLIYEWRKIVERHDEIHYCILIDYDLQDVIRDMSIDWVNRINKYTKYIMKCNLSNKNELQELVEGKIGILVYRYLCSLYEIGKNEFNIKNGYTDEEKFKFKMSKQVMFHKYSKWLEYYEKRAIYIREQISNPSDDNILDDEPDYEAGTFQIGDFNDIIENFRTNLVRLTGTDIVMQQQIYNLYMDRMH